MTQVSTYPECLPGKAISEPSRPKPINDIKHFRAPKRLNRNPDLPKLTPSLNVSDSPVASEAVRSACLFRARSDAFRLCDDAAYGRPEVADFIICSSRNRARPLSTLARVFHFVALFYVFATDRPNHFPFFWRCCLNWDYVMATWTR